MGFLFTRKKIAEAPAEDRYERQKHKLPDGYQIEVVPDLQLKRERYHWSVMKANGTYLKGGWANTEKRAVKKAVKWAILRAKEECKAIEHKEGRRISF